MDEDDMKMIVLMNIEEGLLVQLIWIFYVFFNLRTIFVQLCSDLADSASSKLLLLLLRTLSYREQIRLGCTSTQLQVCKGLGKNAWVETFYNTF